MSSPEKPRRKWLRRLVKTFLSLALTVAVLLGIAFAYLYSNQESLRGALVSQINERLNADVKVGNIQMDFFSQFPDVSFRFEKVFCPEVLPATSNDTLFYFDRIYFEFNLWQLIQSKYSLKGISFDHGNVELRMYANGTDNFHFWKETSDTVDSPLQLNLEDLTLTNSTVQFEDHAADVNIALNTSRAELSGGLSSGEFNSHLNLKGKILHLESEEVDWLPNRTIFADLDFKTAADTTAIRNGVIELEQLRMSAEGTIAGGEQHWTLKGDDMSLSRFVQLLPERLVPDKSLVDADGVFDLGLTLRLLDRKLLLSADTRMDNGQLRLKQSGLVLNNLKMDGHFDNGTRGEMKDARLNISQLQAQTRTGRLFANLSIVNFVSPTVSTSGELAMDFEEALTLAETQFWEVAEGQLEGTFNIKKRYANFSDIQQSGLRRAEMKGSMALTNGRLKVANSGLDMRNLSASIDLNAPNIRVVELRFESGESDFSASGGIQNAVVFGETPMPRFVLDIHSNNLNLENVFAWKLNHRQESTEQEEPFRFDFIVNLTVNDFQHRAFTAQKVKGKVYSEGRDIVGQDITFNAVGGSTESRFRWHPDGPVSQLITRGTLRNVDINRLFTEFDNFYQESLTADNIYGRADVDFAVSLYFDDQMSPQLSSLQSETDFTIRQGRLVNYAPLEKLSYFAEVNELKDVHFATLQNHLSIANQNIHIPGMTVKSNVLELWIEGDHGFNNHIDYSLKLQLLDALGRRRTTSDELSEFIEESNRDQPQIPVKIVGPLDNLSISIDRSLLNQGLREEWNSQGTELRELLNGERTDEPTEPEYIFEWNDERDTTKGR